ncbi:MAG TPA: hypothetical protein VGK27_00975 [Candidatus Deferrimicrobiaceae bacterium]
MADLGELMGAMMAGLIRARRVADEQTASLAEYYKDNPLLEGLSIPRIRIPEMTIDLPLLIEDSTSAQAGEMEAPAKIAAAVEAQMKATLAKNNIRIAPAFNKPFLEAVKGRLASLKDAGGPVTKESVVRGVQEAFADTLAGTGTTLGTPEKEAIAKELRLRVAAISLVKEPVMPGIQANIRTADVKERASAQNVVRLKITLKEEGLEWATQASDTGGVIRTLQPE